jgi:phosphate transport system permease protein
MSTAGNPLVSGGRRARRRKLAGQVMEALATAAALLAAAALAIVIITVAKRAMPALNLDFFTQNAAPFGGSGGGIENAIVGTLIITGIATAIALPAGVLLAIFNTEFAPRRLADTISLTLNVLAGVPTIVIGVFIFALVVVGRGQSAFAGSLGLAIVMLPLVARASEEVLRLVPSHLREGGMALGATRSRTVLTVILPTAVGGIVTATIVAVARAAGETAPLLFTTSIFVGTTVNTDPSQAMASIPMVIFSYSEQPDPHAQQQAWAAALVLVAVVLVGSIVGRLLSLRTRRQIEQVR